MSEEENKQGKKRSIISWVIILSLAIYAVLFAVSNSQSVKFNLVFTSMDLPLSFLLLLHFALGFLLAAIFWIRSVFRNNKKLKHQQKEIYELEERLLKTRDKLDEISKEAGGQ